MSFCADEPDCQLVYCVYRNIVDDRLLLSRAGELFFLFVMQITRLLRNSRFRVQCVCGVMIIISHVIISDKVNEC